MRPALSLIRLAVALAALTVAALMIWPAAGSVVAVLWLGILVLCMADLAVSVPRRSLSVSPQVPATGFTGATVMLRLDIAGRRVPGRMDLRLTHDAGLQSDIAHLTADSAGPVGFHTEMPLRVVRRGQHAIRRLSLLYPSRFGLFDIIATWPVDLTVTGLPDAQPILSGAIQSQILPLLDGGQALNLRGDGSEFHQLRDFVPGMDRRSIDWKRSARRGQLVARETRAERNHQIILCVDTGHLMAERLGTLSKLDHAINAALALGWAGALAGDNLGFYSFGASPHRFLPPRPSRSAFAPIQAACAELAQDDAETNHTLGLQSLNARLRRRSLIIIFSDFVDSVTAELLVENLAVIQRQHLILYVTLRDPTLAALTRPANLSLDAVSQAIAANRAVTERHVVLDRLARLGVLCLDTAPDRLTPALISRYVDIKARELI